MSSDGLKPSDWLWRCPEPLLEGRCGLGLRNVRSVMDALLPLRCRPGLRWVSDEAPEEVTDALRRMVRLVWTSATRVGVMGRAASAAAAAAAESDGLEDSWRLKTAAAAVAAFGLIGTVASGFGKNTMVSRLP